MLIIICEKCGKEKVRCGNSTSCPSCVGKATKAPYSSFGKLWEAKRKGR